MDALPGPRPFLAAAARCGASVTPDARINIQTEIVNEERFFFSNRFPRGHYLVWWVRVTVRVSLGVKVRGSVEVRVRVMVSNSLGSG